MKLWPTTTENKYFVKMLWHLLGECVKTTLLLVCSSGTVAIVPKVLFFIIIFYIDIDISWHLYCYTDITNFTIIDLSISYKSK